MALPTMATGLVVGQYVVPGGAAKPRAAQGIIEFTADVPYNPIPVATPNAYTIVPMRVIGVLDAEGYVCTPLREGSAEPGTQGVRLPATDAAEGSVEEWTWTATPKFTPPEGVRSSTNMLPFTFGVPTGKTTDLAVVAKVPASAGVGTEQIVALAASITKAATDVARDAAAIKNQALGNDAGIAELLKTGAKTSFALDAALDTALSSSAGRPLPTRPAKPQVVFTFDDGWARDMSVVKPILDAAGIKASFCIVASMPGSSASRLTWDQVHQLEDEGHEIVDHSLTHASLGDSTDQALIDREVKDSNAIFLAQGILPAGFCWAGQRSTPQARATVRGIYRYALGGTGSKVQPLGTYQMYRETLNHTRDLAQLKRIVDNAKTRNEMLVFLTHSTPEELSETGLANLRGIIDYTKSVGVEITTAGQAFDRVGNLFDSEGTVIDGSGRLYEVRGTEDAVEIAGAVWGGFNQTAALPPQDYAEDVITHSSTTNAANTDWPEKGAGNIITNRANGTNYLFALQEYYGVSGTVYRRRGASLTKWGAWKSSTHNVTSGANTYASDPPSSYPVGTTLQPVTGANVPGTPGGVPGLLITHRASARFCVQEFQVDNGGGLYRRTVSAADEWLPFKLVQLT